MTENYHYGWQENRLKFILNTLGSEFCNNKTLLELAPFNAYFGNEFQKLGADVTCIEGRQELVDNIQKEFPKLKIICANLDTDEWSYGHFDIIVNFGLFYHLEFHHKKHLQNCLNNCDLLFFETITHDRSESQLVFREENPSVIDQGLSNRSGTPTTSYIEDIFRESNAKFTKYTNKELDGGAHSYSWEDGSLDPNKIALYERRFWIVYPNNNINLDE